MTNQIDTKFNLDVISDEILRYLYLRRYDGKFVNLDQAQIELPFPFDPFEIALTRLNMEGYIELNSKNTLLGKITAKGTSFIRTTSFEESTGIFKNQDNKNNRRFWIPTIISTSSLILSILSLLLSYNSNNPNVTLTNDKLISTVFKDANGEKYFFAFQRGTITNDGGRTITLRGFIPRPDLDLIMLTEDGSTNTVEHNVDYKIFLIPDSLTSEQLFSSERNLSNFKNNGLEKLTMLNRAIKPGEICTISLGIILDVFADSTKNYSSVILCGQLFFSNGQKLDFGSGGEILKQ